jgi:phosphoribosylaminoimidazolecarboxamide formyltransferase/IMP cyclohydrolase
VVVDPSDYPAVLRAIQSGGDFVVLRRALAAKVYAHTAAYDGAIASWFAANEGDVFPDQMLLSLERRFPLRYGENPGQLAAFYVEPGRSGLGSLEQLGGKELSFNNLLDLEGALLATDAFADEIACAIVKHTTPCGVAIGPAPLDAYRKALACDPVSAFGSVIAINAPVDAAAAEHISNLFVECLVAPDFSEEAVEILLRKKNLRLLVGKARWEEGVIDFKRVRGGFLAQQCANSRMGTETWEIVSNRQPTEQEMLDMRFAWSAVASVKSNAIVLARDGSTVGIGAGQMSRVDATFLAIHKARTLGHDTKGTALGSDAFFPFRDAMDQAAEAGVTAVVQPGGSVRDPEVLAAADEHGITMVFTGRRQFRH